MMIGGILLHSCGDDRMLHCFEDSIGVVCTSAFLTIRCGVASCQRRVDWSRVKDRLNQSCVRGIFVPYLSLSFRVQVPGGPTGVPKFNYQGRRKQSGGAASFTRSSCCVQGFDCELGDLEWILEAASLRSASALRVGPTLPTVGASYWDWDWNSPGGALSSDDLYVQGP